MNKWLKPLIMLLCMLMVISACGGAGGGDGKSSNGNAGSGKSVNEGTKETAKPANATEKTNASLGSVVIGTAKDPNLASQIIVADDKGYFKEEGLEASVKLFTSGADLVTAAASGDVHFASTGDIPALNLKMNGIDIAVLSHVSEIGGAQAILTSEEYIKDPQKLKGKKIGVTKGTVGEMLVNSYFKSIGINRGEFNVVQVTGADAITAFSRKDIEAFYTWEPFVIKAQEAAGAKVLVRARNVDGSNKRVVGIHAYLFGLKNVVTGKPEVTTAVLKAIEKATQFIGKNPDEAAKIVAGKMGQDDKTVKTIMSENIYGMKIDQQMADDMRGSINFLKEAGLAKKPTTPEEFIFDEPLKKLNKNYAEWK
jgi:NitT/TauT family transport system substrate-binding protein